jgi:hypothetical protein
MVIILAGIQIESDLVIKNHTSFTARVSCSIDESNEGILFLDIDALFFLKMLKSSAGSSGRLL